ncbi:MAG: TIGR01440 family protein [Oscillospiraceae bacterium]|nr:TIGR01440 family protein [Oscillospiraceae bacterium]
MKEKLTLQATKLMEEFVEKANLKAGNIMVIGCSTSEIIGSKIGSNSSPETAAIVFEAIYSYAKEKGIYVAVQCCEHLNRAIVVEKAAVPFAETVNVVPQPKAGGSFATQAYAHFENPVVVEEIKADAGIDIGFTLIGMHLKKVAVPLRLENKMIGEALVIAARTRPKFIGGVRAVYNQELL